MHCDLATDILGLAFFSNRSFQPAQLRASIPYLEHAEMTQFQDNTLTALVGRRWYSDIPDQSRTNGDLSVRLGGRKAGYWCSVRKFEITS